MRALLIIALLTIATVSDPAAAQVRSSVGKSPAEPTRSVSIRDVWRSHSPYLTLDELGSGKGIVFSPDLSEAGNREFYRALGFVYFEDPDWHVVLDQIKKHNASRTRNRIETLIVFSHGTNGDALKLQSGSKADAPRSYIAPAALQENLEGTGIRFCLLAACNAGRLFRANNYLTVRSDPGNILFEPPTLGIINASSDFNRAKSSIRIARRAESHLEVISLFLLSELSQPLVAELTEDNGTLTTESRIAVPEMLIQLLLKDDDLHLLLSGLETLKSREETNDKIREDLVSRFFDLLEDLCRN